MRAGFPSEHAPINDDDARALDAIAGQLAAIRAHGCLAAVRATIAP